MRRSRRSHGGTMQYRAAFAVGMRQWIKQCQGAKPGGRSNGSHVRSLYNTASRSQPAIRVQASGDRSIPELSLPTSACYSRAPWTPGAESRTKVAPWASGACETPSPCVASQRCPPPRKGGARGMKRWMLDCCRRKGLALVTSQQLLAKVSATARLRHPMSLRSWRSTGAPDAGLAARFRRTATAESPQRPFRS